MAHGAQHQYSSIPIFQYSNIPIFQTFLSLSLSLIQPKTRNPELSFIFPHQFAMIQDMSLH
jgi:hypothetical protein